MWGVSFLESLRQRPDVAVGNPALRLLLGWTHSENPHHTPVEAVAHAVATLIHLDGKNLAGLLAIAHDRMYRAFERIDALLSTLQPVVQAHPDDALAKELYQRTRRARTTMVRVWRAAIPRGRKMDLLQSLAAPVLVLGDASRAAVFNDAGDLLEIEERASSSLARRYRERLAHRVVKKPLLGRCFFDRVTAAAARYIRERPSDFPPAAAREVASLSLAEYLCLPPASSRHGMKEEMLKQVSMYFALPEELAGYRQCVEICPPDLWIAVDVRFLDYLPAHVSGWLSSWLLPHAMARVLVHRISSRMGLADLSLGDAGNQAVADRVVSLEGLTPSPLFRDRGRLAYDPRDGHQAADTE